MRLWFDQKEFAFNFDTSDKYEWGQTISRIVVGMILILLSALDVNASDSVLGDDLQYEGSRIWYLATHSWVYVIIVPLPCLPPLT